MPKSKPPPPSFSPAMAIATSLLSRSQPQNSALHQFILHILTISRLTSSGSPRLPNTALQSLTSPKSQISYFDVLQQIVSSESLRRDLQPDQAVNLLSNLVNMGRSRIAPGSTDGRQLVAVLTAYKICLEAIPADTLASIGVSLARHDIKGTRRETDISIDVGDEYTVMSNADSATTVATSIDSATSATLLSITRDPLLSNVIRISTHHSATTRPALFSFLVSLLYAFPTSSGIKENIVNTLVYSSQSDSSRGLLRELWRGWIRSSPLSKALAQGSSTSSVTTSVSSALFSEAYRQDWPNLILLAEMYARCLLTLGDDEFFANPASGNDAMSRNPLSTDEVIGFSALWRNVAFALYWQPELLGATDESGRLRSVVGTNVPLEALRKLATGLLQSLHARECVFRFRTHRHDADSSCSSRKQFAPRGHWIMTSQLDLQSFVESAILEDQKLDEEEEASNMPSRSQGADSDDDMENESSIRRTHATTRQSLPTRRQMAFLSPRLGVLNNSMSRVFYRPLFKLTCMRVYSTLRDPIRSPRVHIPAVYRQRSRKASSESSCWTRSKPVFGGYRWEKDSCRCYYSTRTRSR